MRARHAAHSSKLLTTQFFSRGMSPADSQKTERTNPEPAGIQTQVTWYKDEHATFSTTAL